MVLGFNNTPDVDLLLFQDIFSTTNSILLRIEPFAHRSPRRTHRTHAQGSLYVHTILGSSVPHDQTVSCHALLPLTVFSVNRMYWRYWPAAGEYLEYALSDSLVDMLGGARLAPLAGNCCCFR